MITFFNTPCNSAILIILAVIYGIVASITTFDIRLIQAKRNGTLPPDQPLLPQWTSVFHWMEWIILAIMILLNWKFGLIAWGIRFILKVLPILEIIGNALMSPFKNKRN